MSYLLFLDQNEAEDEDEMSETVVSYKSQIVGSKDTPLERRALMSLEKQLEVEIPDSKLDLRVKNIHITT